METISIIFNIATIIADVAVILYIIRGWKR